MENDCDLPYFRVNSDVHDGKIRIFIEELYTAENGEAFYEPIIGDLNRFEIKPCGIIASMLGKTIDDKVRDAIKVLDKRCVYLIEEKEANERKKKDLELILNRHTIRKD